MAKDGAEKGTQELESKGPLGYDRTWWVFWEATKEVALWSHIYVCVYFWGCNAANSLTGTKLETVMCYDTVGSLLENYQCKINFLIGSWYSL